MMNCVTCEVKRARMYALAMHVLGKSYSEIAGKLSARYSETYFVELSKDKTKLFLMRTNKVQHDSPYRIAEKAVIRHA